MRLSEAGSDFLQFGAAECGHSPNTIKAHRQGVRRFLERLATQGTPDPDVRSIPLPTAGQGSRGG
jgi:hypothetical protein